MNDTVSLKSRGLAGEKARQNIASDSRQQRTERCHTLFRIDQHGDENQNHSTDRHVVDHRKQWQREVFFFCSILTGQTTRNDIGRGDQAVDQQDQTATTVQQKSENRFWRKNG